MKQVTNSLKDEDGFYYVALCIIYYLLHVEIFLYLLAQIGSRLSFSFDLRLIHETFADPETIFCMLFVTKFSDVGIVIW